MEELVPTDDTPYYSLHEDVVLKEILPKLPVKSLLKFKWVSKTWLSYISNDSSLVSTHLEHHSKRLAAAPEFPDNISSASNEKRKLPAKLFHLGHDDDTKHVEIDTSYMNQALREVSEDDMIISVSTLSDLATAWFVSNQPTTPPTAPEQR